MQVAVRDWDALMNEVASEAAQAIVPSSKAGHALERDLEIALVSSLAARGCPTVTTKRIPYDYPGWMPQPGPLDLGIYDGDHVVVACELKLHDIDWGLYDLVKVVSLFRAAKPVAAAFLITGGTQRQWARSGLGECFAPGPRTVATIDLLRANPKAWSELMYVHKDGRLESSGRPRTVASRLLVEGFPPHGCDVGAVGDLRVMSVRPAGQLVDVPEELRPILPL